MAKLLGGTRIYGNLFVDGGISAGNISIANTTPSTSTTTGAFTVTGGVGIGGNLNVGTAGAISGQYHTFVGNITQTSSGGAVYFNTTGNILAATIIGSSATINGTANVNLLNSTGNILAQAAVFNSVTTNGTETVNLLNSTGNILAQVATVGAVQAAGVVYANSSASASSSSTGAIVVPSGGIAIGSGVNSSANNNGGALTVAGGAAFSRDVWIGGNLYVANIYSQTTQILQVNDPLLYLYTANTYPYNFDIGFYSHFIGGPANAYAHSGLVRDYTSSTWTFFSNVSEPSGGVVTFDSNTAYDTLKVGNIVLAAGSNSGGYLTAGTISATGNIIAGLAQFAAINSTPIGNATPAAGTFTNISSATAPTTTVPALALTGTPNSSAGGKVGVLAVGSNFTASDKNIMASFVQNINDYTQIVVQNPNSGASASADFIVNNDNTSGIGTYGDFGINSSGFTGTGSFNAAGAVYLYAQGGDLVVGTQSSNIVRFVIGSATATDIGTVTTTGLNSFPIGATAPSTGAFTTLSASGNLTVLGISAAVISNIHSTTTGTNGNLTLDPDGTGWLVVTSTTPTIFQSTAASTNTTTGALQVSGGVGIVGNLNVGSSTIPGAAHTITGNVTITSLSTPSSAAALTLQAGSGINTAYFLANASQGALNATTIVNDVVWNFSNGTQNYGNLVIAGWSTVTGGGGLRFRNDINQITTPGQFVVANTTASTSTTTGALQVTGGGGIAGNLAVGGNINLTTAGVVGGGGNILINGVSGTIGQVLTQGGAGVYWATSGTTISDNTLTNASYYVPFAGATSGSFSTAYINSSKLYFNPSSGTLYSTVFQSLSDQTAKTNIEPVADALSVVRQLEGVGFTWLDNGTKSWGVIAQAVERIISDGVVTTDVSGRKSVNYAALTAFLIEAIKQQDQRITELERRLGG